MVVVGGDGRVVGLAEHQVHQEYGEAEADADGQCHQRVCRASADGEEREEQYHTDQGADQQDPPPRSGGVVGADRAVQVGEGHRAVLVSVVAEIFRGLADPIEGAVRDGYPGAFRVLGDPDGAVERLQVTLRLFVAAVVAVEAAVDLLSPSGEVVVHRLVAGVLDGLRLGCQGLRLVVHRLIAGLRRGLHSVLASEDLDGVFVVGAHRHVVGGGVAEDVIVLVLSLGADELLAELDAELVGQVLVNCGHGLVSLSRVGGNQPPKLLGYWRCPLELISDSSYMTTYCHHLTAIAEMLGKIT